MKLLHTDDSWASLVLRLMLGIVMFPHGVQKVFGWFGGQGFSATMTAFTQTMHIPPALACLVIAAESLGSLGLVSGFLTRVAAFGILCDMVGAIILVHAPYGFFMNWFGKQAGEGFEYHLLMIGMALALMMTGGGRWSVDRMLSTKHRKFVR